MLLGRHFLHRITSACFDLSPNLPATAFFLANIVNQRDTRSLRDSHLHSSSREESSRVVSLSVSNEPSQLRFAD